MRVRTRPGAFFCAKTKPKTPVLAKFLARILTYRNYYEKKNMQKFLKNITLFCLLKKFKKSDFLQKNLTIPR